MSVFSNKNIDVNYKLWLWKYEKKNSFGLGRNSRIMCVVIGILIINKYDTFVSVFLEVKVLCFYEDEIYSNQL